MTCTEIVNECRKKGCLPILQVTAEVFILVHCVKHVLICVLALQTDRDVHTHRKLMKIFKSLHTLQFKISKCKIAKKVHSL